MSLNCFVTCTSCKEHLGVWNYFVHSDLEREREKERFPPELILQAMFTYVFLSGIQITFTFNIKEPENKLQESVSQNPAPRAYLRDTFVSL